MPTRPEAWCRRSMEDVLDRAFGRPRGVLGRIGAALMARGNAAVEHQVVDIAGVRDDETVLVLGPGPGVGLRAAGERAAAAIGVDPSEDMLRISARRCADLVRAGTVRIRKATAEQTGLEDESVDVALTVNNVHIWSDRAAGFAEIARVLRPGGRIVLSVHQKFLPVTRHQLASEVEAAGFADVQSWTWDPPGVLATRAVQLRAVKKAVNA